MSHSHDRDAALECLLLRLGNGVRETLHNVMGLLELTLQEPLSTSQTRYVTQCRAITDRLLRASNDAAELASGSDWPLSEATFSVRGMVEELAQFAQPLAARRGIRFSHQVATSVPVFAVADRAILQDTIHRLLDNSLRLTEHGFIQLTVNTSPAMPDCLVFDIADSGPGFPEEFLRNLNAPLSLEHSRGLGLPIVRRRVNAMGGVFSVLSSTPEGAVVTLAVPVKPAHVQRQQPSPEHSQSMRILVVEDCDDSYLLFEAFVAGEGHSIHRVRDGSQALDARIAHPFDIIFMDVNMPIMDGYTATHSIRDWETAHARTHVPIVLLSADDRSRQQSLGAAAGCSGYLTKPTSQSDLLAALYYYAHATTHS
ncbi:MAG: response regulator [Bryobacteraceae bacterium]